ncbi:hypothetical protein [Halpernia sp. GG3]
MGYDAPNLQCLLQSVPDNEIVLPAGIFIVPGTKDADLDDALVYGYAAACCYRGTKSHMVLMYDQGRQFDAQGNL